jgi:hydroxymethylglutaryl-CoA reductase (NADPH)
MGISAHAELLADMSSSHVCTSACHIVDGGDLYFEVLLKNLLVATVGGGTGLGTQRECLRIMECEGDRMSDKLAELIAATVLVGEFVTAAAVVNESYVASHERYGRNRP